MKLPMRLIAPGMVIVTPNEEGEPGEPDHFRFPVLGEIVTPLMTLEVEGGTIMAPRDAEQEVEIPGFVEHRKDICGCEWIVVDEDSPIPVDATDDSPEGLRGYLKIKDCDNEGHEI